ncbi:hypothetical protein FSP39_012918 [Pinctada imbricata]|uniref:N-acylglucosamine 2-epimerase n=1 Tax=Pinctada imbricata TaxID=66713 RepID=A0AA88YP29_PINIB|nr:hypothetical protein FSP39_012918 [Pinctada imbricata]
MVKCKPSFKFAEKTMSVTRLEEFLEKISTDLDRTVKFWLTHSHDLQYGSPNAMNVADGYPRSVWMYCKLYTDVERFHKQEILDAAVRGADFLMKHAKNPETNKCHLVVTRDGKSVKIQGTLFSECFYLMAMSELARASGETKYKEEACQMMKTLQRCVETHGESLGIFKLEGVAPSSMLAIPMMILCVIDQLETMDPNLCYKDLSAWAVQDALKHVQVRDMGFKLEYTIYDLKLRVPIQSNYTFRPTRDTQT